MESSKLFFNYLRSVVSLSRIASLQVQIQHYCKSILIPYACSHLCSQWLNCLTLFLLWSRVRHFSVYFGSGMNASFLVGDWTVWPFGILDANLVLTRNFGPVSVIGISVCRRFSPLCPYPFYEIINHSCPFFPVSFDLVWKGLRTTAGTWVFSLTAFRCINFQ